MATMRMDLPWHLLAHKEDRRVFKIRRLEGLANRSRWRDVFNCYGFSLRACQQTEQKMENYNDNKAQSEPKINREHEERKHETLCDEIN